MASQQQSATNSNILQVISTSASKWNFKKQKIEDGKSSILLCQPSGERNVGEGKQPFGCVIGTPRRGAGGNYSAYNQDKDNG